MSDNPDAYMRSHRLDIIFKEILSELAIQRPERPFKPIVKALEAVDATANRDPEHLLSLVREAFKPASSTPIVKLCSEEAEVEMEESWDSFGSAAVQVSDTKPKGFNRGRRGSVSAESYDPEKGSTLPVLCIPKTASERERLARLTSTNLLMRGVSPENRQPILDAMFERKVKAGEDVIRQGDIGDNFYIVESGLFSVLVEGKGEVTQVEPGQSFGELALMYNQPRQATVRALADSIIWGLDGATFRKVIIDISYKRRLFHKDLLSKVPLFATLSPLEVSRISEALVPIQYAPGEIIIQQGDYGQEFFIISEGQTEVFIDQQAPKDEALEATPPKPTLVNTLGPGDYFGELALLNKEPRTATVKALTLVKCLTLSRSDFTRLMGPLLPYLERNQEHYRSYEQHIPAQ